MFSVDLNALGVCSGTVVTTSFDSISQRGSKVFTDWLVSSKLQLKEPIQMGWEDGLRNALKSVWDTKILMPQGPDKWVGDVAQFVMQNQKQRPIYPIINSAWKSDAWLTGLVINKLADAKKLNSDAKGFGLNGKPNGEMPQKIPLKPLTYDLMYVDDASYSGTQLNNILNSVFLSGLRPGRIFLMLAGISMKAGQLIYKSKVWAQKCQQVGDEKITTLMETWNIPGVYGQQLRTFYGNMSHIEADPQTLSPKATTGEFQIFTDVCLTMPSYKIPDSLSVPTHLYLAYNPTTKTSIFEHEGGHIFTGKGSTTYREVMGKGATVYASQY